MFGVVFQRRVGTASLIALTLLLLGVAGAVGAVRPLAMSSTHQLSRAHVQASSASGASVHAVAPSLSGSSASFVGRFGSAFFSPAAPLLSSTGCGAAGTIADQSGFEDA